MAFMNQERKAQIAPAVKAILKKYKMKGTLSIRHHMSLVLTITSGAIDFINNCNETIASQPGGFRNGSPAVGSIQINPYWYHEHFTGKALDFLSEVIPAMNTGNHDNSDIQSDYFDVGFYVDVNIGQWDKPYILQAV